jgi:hypothetical protein
MIIRLIPSSPAPPPGARWFRLMIRLVAIAIACSSAGNCSGQVGDVLNDGLLKATIAATESSGLRTYELTSNAELRDGQPPGNQTTFSEVTNHARIRTGNLMFDGLYALAVSEALQNSVAQIKDGAYGHGEPTSLQAFQTGEFWTYVWTRDLAYSTHLALGSFDPERAVSSLLFKTSPRKSSVAGGYANQIIQDTGSGGSYPVSSDRIVWILGADATLNYLPAPEQKDFLAKIYPILHDTLEEDRRMLFDFQDGLYRGEQSFLDWREQTYPGWTKDSVIAIAMSKALSVNVANYFALRTAADYSARLGLPAEHNRYTAWAAELKAAINEKFFDHEAGLYSTYILTDSAQGIRAHRYDLLGESLAILTGVADDVQAKSILRHYPVGEFGPPVVWPQERTVPIYHNHAIWPFVTAYWIKAARQAGCGAAVDAGVRSLMRGAAFNLSNMENYDLATGKADVKAGVLSGPVVNSRRQLWSVAGYLAMADDVVFGLEISADGIRFLPFVTSRLRNELFAASESIELQNFIYQGKSITVSVHLPAVQKNSRGVLEIGKIGLNGKIIGRDFVAADSLQKQNTWDIYLQNSRGDGGDDHLNFITGLQDGQAVFGPAQPRWKNVGQGGVTVENDLLSLHFSCATGSNTVFNIYRDGRLCAKGITVTDWVDPHSGDFTNQTYFYAIEALDARTGNASHLTPSRFYAFTNNQWEIPAMAMENRGGSLADGRYFMNWGRPEHELLVKNFTAPRSGEYLVRTEFSNGAGPVNTGITCAVKKMEIRHVGSGELATAGYLVMPQSGDWQRFDLSSILRVRLKAGEQYSFRIFEDEYSRNMSYLAQNERYTAWPGGGSSAYNFVNIAGIQLTHLAD